ncbi:hypothetical protein AMS68_006715 [Peltaster fructicola]|uniref:AB hydrolase-1 domain-containing protein n=1 Tax=Peltaster fructicola TaxID=286661 RepID=A0A6H0Y2X0_9PEZI|nr:hypothetical protein AMS68_006715 [Peltaster fructicola]
MEQKTSASWGQQLNIKSSRSPFESPLPPTLTAFKDVIPVSFQRLHIAGILLTVYGLDELSSSRDNVACIWLLHGRNDSQDSMGFVAAALLNAWNGHRGRNGRGLICICFDQRNHGSRLIDIKANDSWKAGNPHHAVDMWTLFSGTAQDVSLLITHLPTYLSFTPSMHICSGVSLGGHATWQALLKDPRINAALIVVGCADYVRLMTDRAIRSKLESCMNTVPVARNFLGSKDFPQSLIEEVERSDPSGVFLGELDTVTGDDHLHPPSKAEISRLNPLIEQKLAAAIDKEHGWCKDQGISLTDVVDPEGGHEFSIAMRREAEQWLCRLLSESGQGSRGSKM